MKTVLAILGIGFLCTVAAGFLFVSNYGINGSGISATEIRDLETFDEIMLAGVGRVNISTGDVQQVVITTDDNLLQHIHSVVEDGRLEITQPEPLNPKVDLVIDITVPKLHQVDIAGASTVHFEDVDVEDLDVSISGACRVEGTGTAQTINLDMAGACKAVLKDFVSAQTIINLSGTGTASVHATETLEANVSGLASVTCYGSPTSVNKNSSGLARIKIAGN